MVLLTQLDPDNAKSIEDVQAERRADMDLEFEMDDNESNEEEEEDSVDIETEDADDVHEEKEEADQTSTTQPTRRATIAELRERLHNKIQMLHNKRHPHDTTAKDGPSTKEELLEARRKQRGEMRDRRRRERKEARKLAKAGVKGTSTDKPTLAAGNARSAGLLVHDANGMTMTPTKSDDNLDTNLSFSQVSFETSHAPDPARKNKYALPKDPKAALASLEARKRKEEARIQKQIEGGQDAAQAREAALESERWGKALAAAEGVRIRDNVHMLKQTIKRREKSKEKSTKTWYVPRPWETTLTTIGMTGDVPSKRRKPLSRRSVWRTWLPAVMPKRQAASPRSLQASLPTRHALDSKVVRVDLAVITARPAARRGLRSDDCCRPKWSRRVMYVCSRRQTRRVSRIIVYTNSAHIMSTSNHDDVGVKAETTTPVFQNPYEGHRSLSASEQQVLGEYARLAATLRRVRMTHVTHT